MAAISTPMKKDRPPGATGALTLDPTTTTMTSTKPAHETIPTRPPSDRNGGRDQIGIGGRLRRNPQQKLTVVQFGHASTVNAIKE